MCEPFCTRFTLIVYWSIDVFVFAQLTGSVSSFCLVRFYHFDSAMLGVEKDLFRPEWILCPIQYGVV